MKSKTQMNRRTFLGQTALGLSAAGLASPFLSTPSYAAGEEITLLTWETYSEDPWIEAWTEKTGVKVNAVRAGGVDEAFARLQSGSVVPDVIYLDPSAIPRLRQMDVLAPIDATKIANIGNIAHGMDYTNAVTFDDHLYALPYNWGPIPMMYREDIITGDAAKTWMTMLDEKYRGRVSVPDDAFMTLPVVAMMAGAANPYNLTEAEFDGLIDMLRRLRPQVKALTQGNNDTEALFASGEVDLGICQNPPIVVNLRSNGHPVQFGVPAEGASSWLDCALLTKHGDRDVVYDFLNETLSLEWQKRFIEFAVSPGVLDKTTALEAGVSAEVVDQTVMPLLDQEGFWSGLKFFEDVEDVDRRLQIWNDFKAGIL